MYIMQYHALTFPNTCLGQIELGFWNKCERTESIDMKPQKHKKKHYEVRDN